MKKKVLFIMPSFNEGKIIEKSLDSWLPVVHSIPGSKLLVIDGGSKDNTQIVLKKLFQKYKNTLILILKKTNDGHGTDLLEAYKYAINTNFTWIFQTDSDGHFQPSDFFKLWDKRNISPFILGYRYKREDVIFRKVLTLLIRTWIHILFGSNIKDSNIPFRLIRLNYLKTILPKVKAGVFAPNIHLSVLAAKDHKNLLHIPVEHRNPIKRNNNIRILKGSIQGFFELITLVFETK